MAPCASAPSMPMRMYEHSVCADHSTTQPLNHPSTHHVHDSIHAACQRLHLLPDALFVSRSCLAGLLPPCPSTICLFFNPLNLSNFLPPFNCRSRTAHRCCYVYSVVRVPRHHSSVPSIHSDIMFPRLEPLFPSSLVSTYHHAPRASEVRLVPRSQILRPFPLPLTA